MLFLGVAGAILGRYLLTLYIPLLLGRFFNSSKNEDVQFLGEHLKAKGWQSQAVIMANSLLPLPTTPPVFGGRHGPNSPNVHHPGLFLGKVSSDSVAVAMDNYAAQKLGSLRATAFFWQPVAGLGTSLLLLLALLFIDWRALIQQRKFTLVFNILK